MARGVRQGCTASGLLFAMAFDGFMIRSSLQTLLHQTSCKLLLVPMPMISLFAASSFSVFDDRLFVANLRGDGLCCWAQS